MDLPNMGPHDPSIYSSQEYLGLKDRDSPNRFPFEAVIEWKPDIAMI